MATIDENGKIRDGRDRKVDGTLTKLKSGRLVFNCSTCAEDFKNLEEIISHIDSVHSTERIIEPIASTSTQYLKTTHFDENLTDPVLKNAIALPEFQSTSNESKKRKGYTPFMDAMNGPKPKSRYNSKVRLDMIIFDSTNVKKEQHYTSTNTKRNFKPKLTIDRSKLADTISRLNIVNRRKESIELVANELRLRLPNSSGRLWLANQMKSPIDKMNQRMHKTNGSKKTSFKKKPLASKSVQISTSTEKFKGFSKKDSKNAMLEHSNVFQTRLRLCRVKTEIDPTEVMYRYGINNYRKETVDFIADQLNIKHLTSYEREQLRSKMRTTINQKKFLSKSGSASASFAIKKDIYQG